MIVIALLAISALLDGESGVGIWLELRDDLSGSAARVSRLEQENDSLRSEIAALDGDPDAIERAIREELDLVKPGEIVVHFVEPPEAARALGSDAAAGKGSGDRGGRALFEDRVTK
jgi:cell division protein FtsB